MDPAALLYLSAERENVPRIVEAGAAEAMLSAIGKQRPPWQC